MCKLLALADTTENLKVKAGTFFPSSYKWSKRCYYIFSIPSTSTNKHLFSDAYEGEYLLRANGEATDSSKSFQKETSNITNGLGIQFPVYVGGISSLFRLFSDNR